MRILRGVREVTVIVAVFALIFGCIADRALAQGKGNESTTKDDANPQSASGQNGESKKKVNSSASGQKFDPALISAGRAAFDRSCTSCHDAARSLDRKKDLSGWRATVRRMAAKRGADIATEDIEPISIYLTSRNAAGSENANDKEQSGIGSIASASNSDSSSISTFATLSPQWRGGNHNLQNPGFAPLAWVGASWQGKTLSGRVTACISCHGVQEQAYLNRIELVEAAVRVDLSEFLASCCSRKIKGGIDAGRLIVPFGAFSSQTNPGVYRTVSTPLIFNMGQRVFNRDLGDVVLPMPYTDTGANFNLDVPITELGTGPLTASVDTYLINGLQGSSNGVDFLQSRSLLDNNDRASYGGRITVGDPYLRAGTSVLSGRFDDPNDTGVTNRPLNYRVYGFDIQARYKKIFRAQAEYARRDTDRIRALADGSSVTAERVDGYYLEAEIRPWEECRWSLLARHDFLRRNCILPPPASSLPFGTYNVERVTFGINIELWHQSLLMLNYERWLVPEPSNAINVYGVRYTVTF